MRAKLIPLALVTFALAGCATLESVGGDTIATAPLELADGSRVGLVTLSRNAGEMTLAIDAYNLPSGLHGFHLHQTGSCIAPDFKSAGGHLNPAGKQHGSENPMGKHLGDLPNLTVGSAGTASTSVVVSDDPQTAIDAIFDADGTAVVIHAGPDDYKSDPAGDAGSRIACGVLKRPLN